MAHSKNQVICTLQHYKVQMEPLNMAPSKQSSEMYITTSMKVQREPFIMASSLKPSDMYISKF